MRKKHFRAPVLAERYPLALLAGLIDVFLVLGSAFLAYYWRFGTWSMSERYEIATLALVLLGILCQTMVNSYGSWRGRRLLNRLGRVYTGWLIAFAMLFGLAVLLKVSVNYSRLWVISTFALALVAVTLFRLSMFLLLRFVRSHGRNLKQVLVVEGQTPSAELDAKLPVLPEDGYRVAHRMTLRHTPGVCQQ